MAANDPVADIGKSAQNLCDDVLVSRCGLIIAFAISLAMAAAPAGVALPTKLYGSYALFDNDALSCSEANSAKVVLTPTTLSVRGEKLPILMIEQVSDHSWHIWVKARSEVKGSSVEELHFDWDLTGSSDYLVIASDAGAAEAILKYGKAVADAGVWGGYKRCPNASDR